MTNGRVEVITSVERRRRWSSAEKQRLVAAALEPGASRSDAGRLGRRLRHDLQRREVNPRLWSSRIPPPYDLWHAAASSPWTI
jgi:transposase-like protein